MLAASKLYLSLYPQHPNTPRTRALLKYHPHPPQLPIDPLLFLLPNPALGLPGPDSSPAALGPRPGRQPPGQIGVHTPSHAGLEARLSDGHRPVPIRRTVQPAQVNAMTKDPLGHEGYGYQTFFRVATLLEGENIPEQTCRRSRTE